MAEWLLGLVGITFVSVIVDVILPAGRTKNIIKCVMAIFCVYVIIAPLPKIFSDATDNASESIGELDENFLQSTNAQMVSAIEESISKQAENAGLDGVSVVIWADLSNNEIEVKKVYVDLLNVVLSENNENINKYELLTEIVQQNVDVSKEDITFYG